MDGLALRELDLKFEPIDGNDVRGVCDQMHLDAAELFVVAGKMAESVDFEVAAQSRIDALEDVFVEARGHTLPVIVSGLECVAVFAQIDADEEVVLRLHGIVDAVEERDGILALEVADVGAQPEDEPALVTALLEILEAIHVFTGNGEDLESGKVIDQSLRALL